MYARPSYLNRVACLLAVGVMFAAIGCTSGEKDAPKPAGDGERPAAAGKKPSANEGGKTAGGAPNYLTDDIVGAIIIRPKQILESKLFAQLPMEEPLREIEREIPIDPKTVDEVQIFISADTIEKLDQRILPSFVVRFNKEGAADQLLGNIPSEERKDADHEGHKYIRVEQKQYSKQAFEEGDDFSETEPEMEVVATFGIYQPDGRTVVVAEESRLKKMLTGGKTNAELTKRLEAADQGGQFVVVYHNADSAAVEKMLSEMPPQAVMMAASFVRGAEWLVVALNVDKNPLIQVTFDGKDKPAAENIKNTLEGLFALGKQGLTAAREEAAGQEDAVAGIGMAEAFMKSISVKQDDQRVNVTLVRPADMDAMIAKTTALMEAARAELQSSNNMKQVGLAFFNYESSFNALPPGKDPQNRFVDADGKPLLSWRVQILPYLEQNNLYDSKVKFGEAWDSPSNKPLLETMPEVFLTPGVPNEGKSTYQVFTGEGTYFNGRPGGRLFGAAGDGPTILLVEVSPDKATPWTQPGGIPIDSDDLLAEIGKPSKKGYRVVMNNGAVQFLKPDITAETLRALATRDGGEEVKQEDYLAAP